MSNVCFGACVVTSATSVSVQRKIRVPRATIKPCNCSGNSSLDNSSGDEHNGAVVASWALANSTSVFMPQMRAQHVAFAVLAVRLKLSVFTSSALALRTVRHCNTR